MASPKHPHLSKLSHFFHSRTFSSNSHHNRASPKFPSIKDARTSIHTSASPSTSPNFTYLRPSGEIFSIPTSEKNHHRLLSFKDFLSCSNRTFHYDNNSRNSSYRTSVNQATNLQGQRTSELGIGGFGTAAAISTFALFGDPKKQRMNERLKEYGFEEKEVRGDGNCQFRAIADQIYGSESKHQQVRREIIDWLASNPHHPIDKDGTKLADFLETDRYPDWKSYCHSMSRDGYWGDHLTLVAASEVYNAKLTILSSVDTPVGTSPVTVIEPSQRTHERALNFSLWHEKHYNSMYPIHKVTQAP